MKNKVILVDIDDVVADLITPWLNWYNNKYSDNLRQKDITDWNIANFVRHGCGDKVYEFVNNPGIYSIINPIKGAKQVVKSLQNNNNRVIFVTAFTEGIKGGVKLRWLNANGFNVMPFDYYEMNDKSMINGDLFIDDGWHNIEKTIAKDAYLYNKPWNKKYEYGKRVSNWKEIAKLCDIKVGLW